MLALNGRDYEPDYILPAPPPMVESELRKAAVKQLLKAVESAGTRALTLASPADMFDTWAEAASDWVDAVMRLITAEVFWAYDDGFSNGIELCISLLDRMQRDLCTMVNRGNYESARMEHSGHTVTVSAHLTPSPPPSISQTCPTTPSAPTAGCA